MDNICNKCANERRCDPFGAKAVLARVVGSCGHFEAKQEKQPTDCGHWEKIMRPYYEFRFPVYRCPYCKTESETVSKFCPNCGENMKIQRNLYEAP